MLKVRVLTAAVLAPLFVLGVLKLPNLPFSVLIGAVLLLAAWEWTRLSEYTQANRKVAAVVVAAALMAAAFILRDLAALPVLAAACLLWLGVGARLFKARDREPLWWPRSMRWLSGVWVLAPAWLAVGVLQRAEPSAALMLFVLVWAADTGAYFTGRAWGRRQLAPAISPGKTVEGVWGAAAAAVIVAGSFAAYWKLDPAPWLGLTVWSVVTVVASVLGDLFESNWKRVAKLKDSGGLLPGHGGVLDRIDSMTGAAPFFALGWLWWFGETAA